MNLVIVESPAKAKTINKYLGDDYIVLASYGHIRDLPSKNGSVDPDNNFQMEWEVDAAVIAFNMFSSRWTTEILSALYIAGDKRFNQLRTLLRGISSRTLSDKLTACVENGLVQRVVDDGPPIRVMYRLTTHGRNCGRLLGPLVAYMKIHNDLVVSKD